MLFAAYGGTLLYTLPDALPKPCLPYGSVSAVPTLAKYILLQ
jgi:hypothetical protein